MKEGGKEESGGKDKKKRREGRKEKIKLKYEKDK